MKNPQTYLDIVYSQFRKNIFNRIALWGTLLMWAVAIFAPLISSTYPLIMIENDKVSSPWFYSLFYTNGAEVLEFLEVTGKRVVNGKPESYTYKLIQIHPDLFFNMLILAVIPSVIYWFAFVRKSETSSINKAARFGVFYVCTGVLLTIIGSITPLKPAFNPKMDYPEYVHQNQGRVWAVFPPIPFDAYSIDTEFEYMEPFSRKSDVKGFQQRRTNETFVHILGTGGNGYDLLARILYGTRISITVGFIAVSIYVLIGTFIGAIAGYFGGVADILLSRLIEIMIMIPTLFLIAILVALTQRSVYVVMFAIGITGWPGIARLIRAEFLKQRAIDYVAAAQALGASRLRIMFRHILPNAMYPLLVAVPFGIASSAITEGALSIIGYGTKPPTASWGILLNEARNNWEKWWLLVFPTIAIFLAVSCFNMVGNGIRDAVDPKLKGTQ